jgi:thiamine biosynthesis lipoprotein
MSGELGMRFSAMACDGDIRLAGLPQPRAQALADQAIAEVRRIEQKYSRYRADSIVSRINAAAGNGAWLDVDGETAHLLGFADQLWRLSDGLFDITSGVLRRAWNFKEPRLPEAGALEALRPLIGWQHVELEQGAATRVRLLKPGMELDFGGFGKEYAADRAGTLLMDAGVVHGYVNLGGDLRFMGPQPDGEGWRIAIQHPRQPDASAAYLTLLNGALTTSGDYERYIDVDGRRYCHILNPRTLQPVSHWQSISVVAPICTAAGAVSTIAMLKEADAPAFLQEQGVMWLGIDLAGNKHGTGL